jgi:hypothetical protein
MTPEQAADAFLAQYEEGTAHARRILRRELPHLADAEIDELLDDLLRLSDDERRQLLDGLLTQSAPGATA